MVLERQNAELRGKGYALAHAFERVLAEGADAVVVVDADTLVSQEPPVGLRRAAGGGQRGGAGALRGAEPRTPPGAPG